MSIRGLLLRLTGGEAMLLKLLSGSLLARAFGAASGLLLQVLIARLLGVEGSGAFYVAVTVLTLSAVASRVGLDTALLRRAGECWHGGQRERVDALYGHALGGVLLTGLLGAILLYLLSPWLTARVFGEASLLPLLKLAALCLLPLSLMSLHVAILKALDRPVAATLLEVCLMPVLVLPACLVLHFTGLLDTQTAFAAYFSGSLLTAVVGLLMVRRQLDWQLIRPALLRPRLPSNGLNLAGIDLLNVAMASSIAILGALGTMSDAGAYNAAFRIAAQISLLGVIVGGLLAPRFAALHAQGEHQALAQLAQRGTLLMTLLSLPALLPMLLFPEIALLLFGPAFEPMLTPLRILALGQLANVLTGPAGYLLVMTGHEREMRNILLVSTAITLSLTGVLAQFWGANGAAVATATGMSLQNVAAAVWARRCLGIRVLPRLGLLSAPRLGTVAVR